MTELKEINSETVFKRYWLLWKILGINTNHNKFLCGAYDLFITLFITLWYPGHLMIGLMQSSTLEEIFSNIVIIVSCAACSIKHFVLRSKLAQMQQINEVLNELDKRVQQEPDEQYYQSKVMLRNAQRLVNMFTYLYLVVIIASGVKIIVGGMGQLSFPAWFPFDWNASLHAYLLAISYQYIGQVVQIWQNLTNDIYGPLYLCLTAGHVHLLGMRIKKLGYASDAELSTGERYEKLIACFKDYTKLMSMFKMMENTISYVYFTQFISSGINIVVAVVYMLFFAEDLAIYLYYTMHIVAIGVELFPACYYGSVLQDEFERLSYEIFSCNWPEQQQSFRRSVIIFGEVSMRRIQVVAGGMMCIHLDSFFATCKMAYSLFTILRSMK